MYEKPTNKNLDTMHAWITDKMKFYKFYPVKTDIAFDTITMLIEEESITNCSFNIAETHFLKLNKKYIETVNKWLLNIALEKWYNITTEAQQYCIIHNIRNSNLDQIEFNDDYTKVRKIDWNFTTNAKIKTWNDR